MYIFIGTTETADRYVRQMQLLQRQVAQHMTLFRFRLLINLVGYREKAIAYHFLALCSL